MVARRARCSHGKKAKPINLLLGVSSGPNQQNFLNRGANIDILRNDNQAETEVSLGDVGEMPGHRLAIMRDENSVRYGGHSKNFRVGQTDAS